MEELITIEDGLVAGLSNDMYENYVQFIIKNNKCDSNRVHALLASICLAISKLTDHLEDPHLAALIKRSFPSVTKMTDFH